jgi:hypothetical protein
VARELGGWGSPLGAGEVAPRVAKARRHGGQEGGALLLKMTIFVKNKISCKFGIIKNSSKLKGFYDINHLFMKLLFSNNNMDIADFLF